MKDISIQKKVYNPIMLTTIVVLLFVLISYIPLAFNLDTKWMLHELHSSIEGIGGIMCVILSLFLINKNFFNSDYPILFLLSCVFFIIGAGDILHSFQKPNNLFIFYHSFGGFFAGVTSLFIFFPQLLERVSSYKYSYLAVVLFSLLVYFIFLLFPDLAPNMGTDHGFSVYAIVLNVAAGITFLLATMKLLLIQVQKENKFNYTKFSLILAVFAVSYFTFFQSSLWDAAWWLWHIFRLVAIMLVIYSVIDLVKLLITYLSLANDNLNKSKQVLISKNKELEQFTYITSHDLQEPLNSILSFSSLLRQYNYEKLDKIGKQSISIIEESSIRMKEFIRSLLEYSRIGRVKEKTKVNIGELVDDLKNDLHDLIEKENADIEYVGKKMTVNAYRTDLIKLFQNIVINAIRYRKEEEAPFVVINSKELDNEYEFTVADNGIGIETEHYDKIFEVFRRLHTRDKYEGTGIGLAYCKKIVELHHGRIWLDSTPGKGTKFYFSISKS